MDGPRWPQKPPNGTLVDPRRLLQADVDGYLPLLEGTGTTTTEAVRGAGSSPTGTPQPTWGVGPLGGPAPSFTNAGGWSVPGPGVFGYADYAIAFRMRVDSLANSFTPLAVGVYNASGWYLQVTGSGQFQFIVTYAANSPVTFPSGVNVTVGAWQHWAVVRAGGVIFVYRDAVLVYASGNVGSQTTPIAATGPLFINAFQSTTQGGAGLTGAGYSGAAAYDNILLINGRTLSAADVADLHARPWQLFRPARPAQWSFAGGGGGGGGRYVPYHLLHRGMNASNTGTP